MNLRQIREILERNKKVKRSGKYIASSNSNDHDYRLENLEEFRKSINKLSVFPFFVHLINQLKETSIFRDNRDVLIVKSSDKTTVELVSDELQSQIFGLINFINELTKDDKEEIVYVKLPILDTIDELIDTLKELKKAIEIPALEIGGEAKILSCEPSSIWITILVGSTIAVRLIGRLVKIATDANIEVKKGQIFGQYANNLKIKNEVLELFKEAQQEQLKTLIQTGAEEISNSEFEEPDNERVERLKLAIKSISDLVNKGAEFLPSFKSSQEIKNIFPDASDEIKMIEENIKSLLERNVSDENQEKKLITTQHSRP